MRLRATRLLPLGLLVASAALGYSQARDTQTEQRFIQQQRLVDDQLRQKRDELAPLNSFFDLQWGGWLDYYYFNFSDGIQKSRNMQQPGLAVWTRLQMDNGAHEVFARMRLHYTYFNPGDESDRQEDWVGPEFDQLWYQIDFGRAFRLNKPSDPLQLKARIGRQTVEFGTGYALYLPMDAVLLDAKLYDLRVLGLVGKSIRNFPNIDRSPPVASHSDRNFYGVQLAYEGWQRHVPFVYAFWNDDRTRERPKQFFQDFSYDSFYLGVGSKGEIVHNLNYWAEGVYESGRSFGDRSFAHQDYIEAFGWDFGIEKLFDVPMHPRLAGEYMFASGDAGRIFSPTNAAGGNRGDRRDASFVGFGLRDTGIALAPTLSNLHIWRVGGAFNPLEKWEFLRNFEIGTNWFLYHKNAAHGAISDPLADEFNGYVGWEMDYFINWRLSSDLAWTMRYGTFYPGPAYTERDTRHFLFTGITWSF